MKLEKRLKTRVCHFVAVLWLTLFGFTTVLRAESVDVEKAKAVALTQLKKTTGDVGLRSASALDLVYEPKNETNQPYFYVFNGNTGFVIVSGDDRVSPVLAYSDNGDFDPNNIPPNMAEFLKGYQKEIDYVVRNGISSNDANLKTEWNNLRSGKIDTSKTKPEKVSKSLFGGVSARSYTVGDYLVKTNWDQISPYNALCPYDAARQEHTAVGCVATAMAQIMRYWGTDRGVIPVCQGSNSYSKNGYSVYADFGNAAYDYTKMPEKIDHASAEEKNMIALLSYHCGVASDMAYGPSSGTPTKNGESGFKNYLGFNAKYIEPLHSVFSDTATNDVYKAWKNTIKKEIDELRPIIYVASGSFSGNGESTYAAHAWICDGYNAEDFFHMNWGYGGRADQVWCRLTAMMSSVGYYSFIYYQNTQAIIHIYPKNIPTEIVYVTPEGIGDGSSWANATSNLYGEMKKEHPAPTQIWVKKGVYYGNTSDTVAFILGNGCNVFGGFAGTEQSLEERILNSNNASVLDGQHIRKVIGYTMGTLYDSAYVDGFTIQNGKDLTGNGGGIYLGLNGIIKNCIIKNCIALNGGGVYKHNEGKIIDCVFENNTAVNDGGGLFCYEYKGSIASCSISRNNAVNGAGIYIQGNAFIDNGSILYNTATTNGGGIFHLKGSLLLSDHTEIKNNEAKFTGGGLHSSGQTIMNSGVISENKANAGGGLSITGSFEAHINGGIISNNNAVSGGGIRVEGSKIVLNGGLISGNNATDNGGGIYCYGALEIPKGSTVKIQSNSATSNGGGIYSTFGWAFINGGMIGVYSEKCPVSKEEAISLGGNYANDGAGIYGGNAGSGIQFDDPENVIVGGNYANNNGGGIYMGGGSGLIKENVTICGNTANIGGGLFLSADRDVSLHRCIIKNNKTSTCGGGVYNNVKNNFKLYVYDAEISGNVSSSGGGVYNIGNFIMYGGTISSNTANDGGGIYNQGTKTNLFSMSGGEISSNTANNGPGIYNYRGGNYNLSNSAKIYDVIYSYNTVDVFNGSLNPHFNVSGLTHHTDYTKPITIQLSDPANSVLATLARYSTPGEAAAAVSNGTYIVFNHGWRPVAMGTDVRIEAYTPPVVAKDVIHITPEGSGTKDGSSWANASPNLYGEMMKDRTDTMQIWVKAGVYYGNRAVGQGGNLAAFTLGKRNKVYGGFAGNESSLSARAQTNPSILDGQRYRRVLCQLTDFADADSSFMDGFTIQNGLDTIPGTANVEMITGGQSHHNGGSDMTGNGGGAYLRKNGILINCVVENCKARSGGGVFNYGGKVINCSFNYNEAEHGGGLFNRGTASFTNCTVSNNKTAFWLGYGGGIYNMATLYILDNTLITQNKGIVGNGIYTHSIGTTTMNGGEISENTGGYYGGGIYSDGTVVMNGGNIINNQAGNGGGITSHGKLTLNSGSISYNTSNSGGGIMNGGGLWINSSSVKIQGNYTGIYGTGGGIYASGNVYINGGTIGVYTNDYPKSQEEALALGGNVAQVGGGIYVDSKGTLTIGNTDSVIIGGNYATLWGGGIHTYSSLTLPVNVHITGNTCERTGGGINLVSNTVSLNGCNISNNKSDSEGGGIYSSGYLYIYNNTMIANNEATSRGGAIYSSKYIAMFGGTITGNSSSVGGGIYNSSGSVGLYGGTIYGNTENGIYNLAKLEVSGTAKIIDPINITSSQCPVEIGDLTYHKDREHPIKIQAFNGTIVAMNEHAKKLLDAGIVISDVPGSALELLDSKKISITNTNSLSTSNEIVDIEKISIYPTFLTSGGMLTVDSPDRGTASVWTLSGMLIGQYKLENGKTQILAPSIGGNYVVKVITDAGEEKSVKIIVK